MSPKPASRRTLGLISVLWPSFLTAVVATIIFFAFFDPLELGQCTAEAGSCRLGVYSIGFLGFWALTILTSLLTCYFRKPCEKG